MHNRAAGGRRATPPAGRATILPMEDVHVPRDCAGRLDGTGVESRAARAILDRLQALEPLLGRNAGSDLVDPGSALARLDERFAASHSVSSLVRQSLAAVMDNAEALRRLGFVGEGSGAVSYRVHTHAPYSLVRTIIECAATVLWALLPEDGRERARRSL